MGWVTAHATAIFSGLLAAFWAAVGIVVRQRATQDVPGDEAMSSAMVTSLVRQPLWWAGTLAAIAGYVFQALALAHGSLLLVQPLLVSSLLFALPLSARICGERITWAQWGWATLLTAALAVFVLVGQPREGHNRPPVPAWTLALAITVPSVIVCVVAAHRAIGRTRAMLLGVAVAILLGMIAVVTKICTHRYSIGGWHALMTVPAPYVLVALAVTVTVVQNSAFHAGSLQASVPIMLVGEPIVAVLLGVVVLGEHLAVGSSAALILVIAVFAMVAATVALARTQAIEVAGSPMHRGRPDSDSTSLAGAGSRGRVA
ncbi:MAG: DMT family transporter [Mycobacterium sp.]|uniref:DMT family transporter n=1 Tax=Mycobacterium sp. TaxID=1785 RepID=UPI001EC8E953|nr:DMT family transporter [Mycobacterium sp.]MBV8787016.1 DMT family transporter [Mycobacterium sp.]